MTELATRFSPKEQTVQTEADTSASPTQSVETPALITEQQVLFGTAAAVVVPARKTHRLRDTVHAVAGAVGAFAASLEKPPARRHYPKRYSYLENSLMAREMYRL
jgi:hypothetical protein